MFSQSPYEFKGPSPAKGKPQWLKWGSVYFHCTEMEVEEGERFISLGIT